MNTNSNLVRDAKSFKILTSGMLFCALIVSATPSFAEVENLNEVVARKARVSTAQWGYSLLQDNNNYFTWQPETLNYSDMVTGREVWRLTNTPSSQNRTQDIAITHWSANGNRVMFHSSRATNSFLYANGVNLIWMLSNVDGSRLKPAKNAAAQLATQDPYVLWSPALSDVLYSGASNDGQPLSQSTLYKVTVSDTTISRSPFLAIPDPASSIISLKKSISGDGHKVNVGYNSKFYPATVYPEASKGWDTPSGYPRLLNFDYFWGGTPSDADRYHDQYMTGAVRGIDGVWNILMPATPTVSDGPYWRARLTGLALNGGPRHVADEVAPYEWGGEIEPVNTTTDGKNKPSPWCSDGSPTPTGAVCTGNMQHGSPDRWGHFLISAMSNIPSDLRSGLTLLDMRTHAVNTVFDAANGNILKISHPDWESWSDWSVCDGLDVGSSTYDGPSGTKHIVAQNYKNILSQVPLVYTHSNYNSGRSGSTTYIGPTQSPDGTKVMFTSTFLNASDASSNLFWAVAYYPYPPEVKPASKSGSNVRLTWEFNQGTAAAPNFTNPRTYATRGWPHETNDRPPSPREVDKFRVWVSDDNSKWAPLGTTSYNNCRGNNECGMWTETSWSYDAAQPPDTTRYYAVTSLEYSGLESRTLSNVWKVTLDVDGNIRQAQQSVYPANPGGATAFYTTPTAPITAQYAHKEAPATADGQYVVKWNAPAENASMIRYYNIYAKDGAVPFTKDTPKPELQKTRIASIPASSDYSGTGAFRYIDWLGAINGSTTYIVTAVDYQGNESLPSGAMGPRRIERVPAP